MITKENIREILLSDVFGFTENAGTYSRHYGPADGGFDLAYNSSFGRFEYPEGVVTNRNTTQGEHQNESYVDFLCVAQLFARGYQPRNIVLEGKNYSVNDKGYCDILVVHDNRNNKYKDDQYLIIECKTADLAQKDDEFRKHWVKTLRNGDQLFRYFNTYRRAHYLCMYAADYPEYTKDGHKEHRFENIYNIISLEDNNEYLQTDSSLRSFQELRDNQGSAEEFFNVWKQTYKQDYNTRGLLEEGIMPFEIGKKNYCLTDLRTVDEYSLEKKYNEFSLILRKHTISSHENAFDKLINLFIAKIIDEKYNAPQLQLLWKGAAYDDYFSLQDRLIDLYRSGMEEFFNDKVTFIENRKIDEAFKFLTSKADVARDTIKRYFRELKYFNNNPFAFLDVHNEQLFFQNAVILKDVINMLQEIYLTSNTDNQFLGDLFEGFLNKGVHQSEGQFFTPIPIVRFLISSLPIEQLVKSMNNAPRAIDYACGAGHFLTEYARQIQPFVLASIQEELENIQSEEERKIVIKNKLSNYYRQIVGIEKDYRLSKVSQVAAYMYGMDGMHIHFSDGLAEISGIENHSFHILVANPPYAVSGFLETLSEDNRKHYELTSHVSNIEKNNAIETFFIERASQLLDSQGVATIVLPASILTKDRIYMRTRELILKTFDIISIVCLGPNTFGQTNTSTVVLFLRRKAIEPDEATHLHQRVEEWFIGNHNDDEYYNDSEYLQAYIERMGYSQEDYFALMRGELTDSFLSTDMAQEYVKALNVFKKSKNSISTTLATEAKKVRDAAQKYVKGRNYKEQTPSTREETIKRFTLQFIQAIEKEKLYYFLLAASNKQQVLVVKSPDNKDKEKKFLGYEWSNAKGKEGIHYLNTKTAKKSSDGEDDEDDTLSQLKGVEGIVTPMFNPLDLADESKINSLIRKNYNGEDFEVEEELADVVNAYSFTDLLDFSRVEFDKQFKTTAILSYPQIETKYQEKEKLGNVAPFVKDKINVSAIDTTSYVSTENMLQNRCGVVPYEGTPNIDKITAYKQGDILISNIRPYLKKVWMATHDGGCSNDVLVFRNQQPSTILNEYLYYLLSCDLFFDYMMVGKTGVKMPRGDKKMIPNFEIPIPPKSIQQNIVDECIEVDKEYIQAENCIADNQQAIIRLYEEIEARPLPRKTMGKLCELNPSKSELSLQDENLKVSFVEMSSLSNDGYILSKIDKYLHEVRKGSYTYFADNDLIFAKITPCMENGKCAFAKGLTNKTAFGSSEFHVFRCHEEILPAYLFGFLNRESIRNEAVKHMTGSSGHRRVPIEFYEKMAIPLLTIEEQKEVITKVEELQDGIIQARQIIDSAPSRKQSILDKYLK